MSNENLMTVRDEETGTEIDLYKTFVDFQYYATKAISELERQIDDNRHAIVDLAVKLDELKRGQNNG